MVMPRSRSSGALSIWSKAVYLLAEERVASTLVMAAVKVVLPWSMWPIVPTFTCGFVRSNFFFAICFPHQNSAQCKHTCVRGCTLLWHSICSFIISSCVSISIHLEKDGIFKITCARYAYSLISAPGNVGAQRIPPIKTCDAVSHDAMHGAPTDV